MAGYRAIEIQIGAVMPDGTVYAGISPDTGRAMYTTPGDVEGTFRREKAQAFNWEAGRRPAANPILAVVAAKGHHEGHDGL